MSIKKILALAALSMLLFIGCQNQEELIQDQTVAISNEEVVSDVEMDNIIDDISTITEDQIGLQQNLTNKGSNPYKSILPDCVKITAELNNGSWTRIVDFGTNGCTFSNGNVLKGKIIISFANDFTSKELVISQRLDGFYHNDTKIEGTTTITRTLKSTPLLADIHPVNTHTFKFRITSKESKIHERIGTRVREMVEGLSTTGNWEDNVYLVWGYSQTKLSNGTIYDTKTDTNPLRFVPACKLPFPTKGTVQYSKTNANNAIIFESKLDFGNGECDKIATLTIKGFSKEIELKK